MRIKGKTAIISDEEIKKACVFAADSYGGEIMGATRYESKLGTVVFSLLQNNQQYIIFRGSEKKANDWAINIMSWPWRVAGRWVHAGFAIAANSVYKKVRKSLDPSKTTICIGHSMGGGCATVTAMRLAKSGFSDVRLITQGRPNVMLKSKKSLEGIQNISIVAGSDLVCILPKIFFEADKSQDIIYLANDGKTNYLNPSKEFRDKDRSLKDAVSDHLMGSSYSPRIKKFKAKELICD